MYKTSIIIFMYTMHKLKMNDDHSFKLKAIIVPHGNEDSDNDNLRTDFCMCPSIGVRIVSSTATICKWFIVRVDAKGYFNKQYQYNVMYM